MGGILPAIRDKFRADVNIDAWLKEGIVTKTGYKAFCERLIEKYSNFGSPVVCGKRV